MLLCLVGKAAVTVAEVLISKSCYSGSGFSLCRCNEVATGTKRRVKEPKGEGRTECRVLPLKRRAFHTEPLNAFVLLNLDSVAVPCMF